MEERQTADTQRSKVKYVRPRAVPLGEPAVASGQARTCIAGQIPKIQQTCSLGNSADWFCGNGAILSPLSCVGGSLYSDCAFGSAPQM